MSVFWNLEEYRDSLAFVQDDGSALTYQQVADRADRFASELGHGKKLVFILCANNIHACVGYLGCLRSKHVPMLLHSTIDKNILAQLVKAYRPNYLWQPSTQRGGYELSPVSTSAATGIHQNLALLLPTSGSTGSPKMARLSYQNIGSNSDAIARYLRLTSDERPITVLPINYSYGLSVINSHLEVGASILLTDESIMQRAFWRFFKDQHATSLVGVPYTYSMYDRLGITKMELPSLRTLTQAGGKMAADKVKLFAEWGQKRGIKLYVMYGQTEATARMSYLPPEKRIEKNASVGMAIPGGRFSIVDMNGRQIEASGINGELVYHGSNVSLGYAQNHEDLGKGDENKGVLRTGDIAQYDNDRYVYITGRLKRFVKIAGNRVGLDEMEAVLGTHQIESICGGRDNLLCIAIMNELHKDGVKAVLEDTLCFHRTNYRIVVADGIPRNPSGKILYDSLFKDVLDD